MASTAFTTAKILGLTGAAWLSGTIASLSLISVPAISQSLREDHLSTAQAVKLWRNNFELGKKLAPPIALASAASLAFCGWTSRHAGTAGFRDRRLFFLAAALTVSIVPYTLVFMGATNDELIRLAGKEGLSEAERRDGEVLLKRWSGLNGVRGLLPLAGAVVMGVVVLV